MANKTLTLTVNATYKGPSDESITMPTLSKSVAYTSLSEGIIEVPNSTASATTYALPMGGIMAAMTGAIIENRTGQELRVTINGTNASANIASGGLFVLGDIQSSTLKPVTAMSLTTTAIQSGQGEIGYRLFGDPT